MRGSQHNDKFVKKQGGVLGTETNNSGGIQGGISNGENIVFRVAFKPAATIMKVTTPSGLQARLPACFRVFSPIYLYAPLFRFARIFGLTCDYVHVC
jgi:hypothetical protein